MEKSFKYHHRIIFILIVLFIHIFRSSCLDACENIAPYVFSKEQKQKLCQNGTGEASAKCAKAAQKLISFGSTEDIISLCRNSISNAPVDCAKTLPRGLGTELKIEICAFAVSKVPAECYHLLKKSKVFLDDKQKAFVCSKAASPFQESVECIKSLPSTFGAVNALRLCTSATSIEPVFCVATLNKGTHSTALIAELCEGAISKAPANCFLRAPQTYHQLQKMELCKFAESDAPVQCVRAIQSSQVSIQQKIELCQRVNSTAPAQCFTRAHQGSSPEFLPHLVRLCRGATSDMPAICFKASKSSMKVVEQAVDLCVGTSSQGPAQCARACPYAISSEQKLDLCRGSLSAAPAHCLKRAQGSFAPGCTALAVNLCQGAVEPQGPAECFLQTSRSGLTEQERVYLCKHAMSDAAARCFHFVSSGRTVSTELRLQLCRGVTDNGPMLCASNAPTSISEMELLHLCRKATGGIVAQCARSVQFLLADGQRALLCAGATSEFPARCAITVGTLLPREQVIALCQHAHTLTPAHCALNLRRTSLTTAEIDLCREAESTAARLRVTKMGFEALALLPGTRFFVHLVLIDQFMQPMIWESGTYITASIPLKGSNGAKLEGVRVNTTLRGLVEFNFLALDTMGNYTLKFSAGEQLLTSFRVVVGWSWDYQQCKSVYDLMNCFPQPNKNEGHNTITSHFVPSARIRTALSCLESFDDAGFLWEAGWNGDLWVYFPAGLESLESGMNLPTVNMNFTERLMVPVHASFSDIKAAYHKLSLQWHPDRWARYPKHAQKSNEIFQLIGEAYNGLKKAMLPQ